MSAAAVSACEEDKRFSMTPKEWYNPCASASSAELRRLVFEDSRSGKEDLSCRVIAC